MAEIKSGHVITFYSYKGGTGRTMALANVACLLARQSNEKVLMIDWDLEAPGLHKYFQFGAKSSKRDQLLFDQNEGLIDLFQEFEHRLETWQPETEELTEAEIEDFFSEIDLDRFIVQTELPSLFLLKAGQFDKDYGTKVNTFSWEALYQRAPWLINGFASYLGKEFGYVLIDSRTGITDTSGICTMLMPDRLVLVFTANRQSLTGILELVERATEFRSQSDDWRPLVAFPLPSRIEMAEDDLRTDWRFGDETRNIEGYQPQFEDVFKKVYALPTCDLSAYFDSVQIQHVPRYAYGEEIAVLVEERADRLSLTQAYETFVSYLTTSIGPWESTGSARDRISTDITSELPPLLQARFQTLPSPLHFRVFLSSPSDVREEREIAVRVCDYVSNDRKFRDHLYMTLASWDNPGAASPMLASMSPQEAINLGLPKPSECDIVIVIIWSRMGTPVTLEYGSGSQAFLSGTEWEYNEAIQEARSLGRPAILVYRRIEPVLLNPAEPEFDQKLEQWKRVESFFSRFIVEDKNIVTKFTTYDSIMDFRRLIENDLTNTIIQLSSSSTEKAPLGSSGLGKIFISYRRSDSGGYAGRIYDRLAAQFGNDRLFMDVESIDPGEDFLSAIDKAISSAAVFLILIGPNWLQSDNRSGRPRIADEFDLIRLELETALNSNAKVIPILLEGAHMPNPSDLPSSVGRITEYQSLLIRTGREFAKDMDRLIQVIQRILST